jgi:hypothetical protein
MNSIRNYLYQPRRAKEHSQQREMYINVLRLSWKIFPKTLNVLLIPNFSHFVYKIAKNILGKKVHAIPTRNYEHIYSIRKKL